MKELADYKMSPELLAVAESYLETNDILATSQMLGISSQEVSAYLGTPDVKNFLNTVYIDQGYLNRNRIQEAMSNIIEKKLEELEDAELGSNKDIAELLMMMHKIRQDELKTLKDSAPTTQTNVQINNADFGVNYSDLLGKLV
jgi:hypothetical protein